MLVIRNDTCKALWGCYETSLKMLFKRKLLLKKNLESPGSRKNC